MPLGYQLEILESLDAPIKYWTVHGNTILLDTGVSGAAPTKADQFGVVLFSETLHSR